MASFLTLITILLALLSLGFFTAFLWAIKKNSLLSFRTAGSLTVALLLLSCAGLFGAITIATQGYRALTREEVAVIVRTEPIGSERFRAHFRFPDGEQATFELAGDELYVDAHILKWKPVANLLGLHTSYELDRVTGRYAKIEDEKVKARTVFSLAKGKPLNMFELRKFYPIFKPLLDVQYGSATFGSAAKPATFEVRVSTTGLLLRDTTVGLKNK